jgi:hypothetical protein
VGLVGEDDDVRLEHLDAESRLVCRSCPGGRPAVTDESDAALSDP